MSVSHVKNNNIINISCFTTLLNNIEKNLNPTIVNYFTFKKYLCTDTQAKELADYLWTEFSSKPNTCIDRMKEISFPVFKFILPCLSREIYSRSLSELPLLGLLYSSEEAKTGKPILKKPMADAIQKTLSNLSQVSKLEREAFFYFLRHTDQTTALTFIDQLFSHPAVGSKLLRVLKDGYGPDICVEDTFSLLTTNLLPHFSPDIIFPSAEHQHLLEVLESHLHSDPLIQEGFEQPEGYIFERFLGRTLLFFNSERKEYLAIKISKNKKDQSDLIREYKICKFFNEYRNEIGLQSILPSPANLFKLSHSEVTQLLLQYSFENQETFKELVNEQKEYLAYTYKASSGYFVYMHEVIKDSDFLNSIKFSLHDLIVVFKKLGLIFDQLVPLYHCTVEERNRPDRGRYMVLSNMIRNLFSSRLMTRKSENRGTGRLPAFKKALAFPNLRAAGIADLGDSKSIHQLKEAVGSNWHRAIQLGEDIVKRGWETHTDLALTANFLGEYLFVIGLLAGIRALTLEKTSSTETWLHTAQGLLEAAELAIAEATESEQERERTKKFINEVIDANRLAKQMQFFMTGEYAHYVDNQWDFPADLYAGNTEVKINYGLKNRESWRKGIGNAADLKNGLDLGSEYGNNPLTELINLCYLVSTTILYNRQKECTSKRANIVIKNERPDEMGVSNECISMELCSEELSEEFVTQQLQMALDDSSHFIKLLTNAPGVQVASILQKDLAKQILLKAIEEENFNKLDDWNKIANYLYKFPVTVRFDVLLTYINLNSSTKTASIFGYATGLLRKLPPHRVWEMLHNPRFAQIFFPSFSRNLLLFNLQELYPLVPDSQKHLLFELNFIKSALENDEKATAAEFSPLGLLLEKLPCKERVHFLKRSFVQLTIQDYFATFHPSTGFCNIKLFIQSISQSEFLQSLKIVGLDRLKNMLNTSTNNSVYFLKWIVKLLPKEERMEFLFDGKFYEIIKKSAPYYSYQIAELLPEKDREKYWDLLSRKQSSNIDSSFPL